MNCKVLVTPRSFAQWDKTPLHLLERSGCKTILNPVQRPLTEAEMNEHIEDVEGLIVGIDPVTSKTIGAAKRLQVISKYGVGVDNIDLGAATERGIVVTFTPGTNTEAVADLTLGLMLAAARKITEADHSVKEGKWERFLGVDLFGRTLGIIGTGRIGRAVARRAAGFDMKILAFTRNPDHAWARECGAIYTSLESLLQESDFVSVHLALAHGTANLINAEKIALMKPTAVLVNTARGGIVDEKALVEALRRERIFGAALDVFSEEPVGDHSILTTRGLSATPHIGSYSRGALERMGTMAVNNLIAVLQGSKPHHVVNEEVYNKK